MPKALRYPYLILALVFLLNACSSKPTDAPSTNSTYTLSLDFAGDGQGKVKLNDAATCTSSCEHSFAKNSKFKLEPIAAEGSSFAGWQGDCQEYSCDFMLIKHRQITATFLKDPPKLFTLNLDFTGTGSGAVSVSPLGLNCESTCALSIEEGSKLSLTAKPLNATQFVGWSGACSGSSSCILSMTEATTVSAQFEVTKVEGDLLINEISSTRYNTDNAWFEIYNASNIKRNLKDYQLRSLAQLNVDPWTFYDETIFDLPALELAPGSYTLVAAKGTDIVIPSSEQVYVLKDDHLIPRWRESGFIELVKEDQSLDFVRFGSSTTEPLSPEAWSGDAAPMLPSAAFEHGKSLVREPNQKDSNSPADWSNRDFVTPAGPNDVPADATDTDEDGIPDSAEVPGGSFSGMDLYAMGARTGQRDIFVELDHMDSSDEGISPQREALDNVVAAFAKHNIALHFDLGTFFNAGPGIQAKDYNLGAGESVVPFSLSTNIAFHNLEELQGRGNFYQYKAAHMQLKRLPIFHYMLMANSRNADGSAGSSGQGEQPGNDSLISLGSWGLSSRSESSKHILINFQASTLMHELGHNLGLLHGGHDNISNYKPNYFSIMNYLYQLVGLNDPSSSEAGDRFYIKNKIKNFSYICNLSFSPCSAEFKMDYSDGRGDTIDEQAIDESAGLGRGASWIDFNNNDLEDMPSLDLNETDTLELLKDYDDWSNLYLPFSRSFNGNNIRTSSFAQTFEPTVNDFQTWSDEENPSQSFFDSLP